MSSKKGMTLSARGHKKSTLSLPAEMKGQFRMSANARGVYVTNLESGERYKLTRNDYRSLLRRYTRTSKEYRRYFFENNVYWKSDKGKEEQRINMFQGVKTSLTFNGDLKVLPTTVQKLMDKFDYEDWIEFTNDNKRLFETYWDSYNKDKEMKEENKVLESDESGTLLGYSNETTKRMNEIYDKMREFLVVKGKVSPRGRI